MANHPNRNGKFELTFVGGASAAASRVLGRYRRKFASVEEVKNRSARRFDSDGTRAARPAIIYGPGHGADGVHVS